MNGRNGNGTGGQPAFNASRPSTAKAMAIKFCGGCNPTFDRLPYWEKIKAATAGAIDWVGPDHPCPGGILLICGCHSACPLKQFDPKDYERFFLVCDDREAPEEVADKIKK